MSVKQEINKALSKLGYSPRNGGVRIYFHSLDRYLVTVSSGYVGIYDTKLHTFVD